MSSVICFSKSDVIILVALQIFLGAGFYLVFCAAPSQLILADMQPLVAPGSDFSPGDVRQRLPAGRRLRTSCLRAALKCNSLRATMRTPDVNAWMRLLAEARSIAGSSAGGGGAGG